MSKIGRNDPCLCGSGRKFKRCCLGKQSDESSSSLQAAATATGPITRSTTGRLTASGVGTKIEELIEAGYKLAFAGQSVQACREWAGAWQMIKGGIAANIKDVHTLEDGLQLPWGTLFNYCQEYAMELGNAGIQDPFFHQQRVEYCTEFLGLLPNSEPDVLENIGRSLGEGYCGVGKPEEAERVFQQLVRDFPHSAWAHIGWGDMYWLFPLNENNPTNLEKAEQIYRNALTVATEKREIQGRLKKLKKEKARLQSALSSE